MSETYVSHVSHVFFEVFEMVRNNGGGLSFAKFAARRLFEPYEWHPSTSVFAVVPRIGKSENLRESRLRGWKFAGSHGNTAGVECPRIQKNSPKKIRVILSS